MHTLDVPALAVLVPTAAVAFVILVRRLRRRAAAAPARVLLVAAVCVYGVGLLRSVLLPYPLVLGDARADLPPWPLLVQLVPLATVPEDPSGMLLNVLLFMPLGFLLPMLLRRPSLPRVTAAGFLVSLSIELVQLIGDLTVSTARIADVDDLMGNTAGTLLGFAVFLAVAPSRRSVVLPQPRPSTVGHPRLRALRPAGGRSGPESAASASAGLLSHRGVERPRRGSSSPGRAIPVGVRSPDARYRCSRFGPRRRWHRRRACALRTA